MNFQTIAAGAVLALISMGSQAANIISDNRFEAPQFDRAWSTPPADHDWIPSTQYGDPDSASQALWNGTVVGAESTRLASDWQPQPLHAASTAHADTVPATATPESGSLAMMLLGAGMMAFVGRRRDDKSTFESR